MKIGLVCPYNMFERAGGVHQVVIHLHDGLKKRGHDVKIITPRPVTYKGDVPEDYILLGTTRNFKGGFGTAGNWTMPPDGDDIEEVLKEEQFDVINFHEPWAPILGWQILNYSTCAHVGTFHANLVDSVAAKSWPRIFTPYARGISQKLHVITAVSPAPVEIFKDKAKDSSEVKMIEDVKYIPNGIDLSFYRPLKKRQPLSGPNTKTVVYVGRLDRRKGAEWLIKAFAVLRDQLPNSHLILAGDGSLRERLQALVKELKLRNVKFMGYVTDEEKRRLMGNADLVCAPSLYGESFGIVLVEAMAMGTPVLGGNNLGYINVLRGYGRLGLIDPKATVDFANRMNVFLSDKGLRKTFRHWALREVKQYEYAKVVDQYEKAYRDALTNWRIEQHLNEAKAKNGKRFSKIARRLFVRRQSG